MGLGMCPQWRGLLHSLQLTPRGADTSRPHPALPNWHFHKLSRCGCCCSEQFCYTDLEANRLPSLPRSDTCHPELALAMAFVLRGGSLFSCAGSPWGRGLVPQLSPPWGGAASPAQVLWGGSEWPELGGDRRQEQVARPRGQEPTLSACHRTSAGEGPHPVLFVTPEPNGEASELRVPK